MKKFLLLILGLVATWQLSAQATITVNPNVDPNGNNYAKIKKVTYYRPDNGQTVVQTSEASGVTNSSSYPIHVTEVEAYAPGSNMGSVITLDYFNFEGVEIRNMNLNSSVQNVGVYENGTTYPASANFSQFQQKLKEFLLDGNMRSMFYYDNPTNLPCNTLPPSCNTQDFDIQFAYAFESSDYLLASERYGNSTFIVIPLDENGNEIGDYVCYGCGGGGNYQKYDWNTGYAPGPYNTSQAQTFTVIPISLFNASGPIFGLRIFNGVGEADVKFYGLSNNTFTNNPINPTVTGLRGNVYNDLDGLTDGTVDGSALGNPDGTTLYAHLVQGGVVVDTREVTPYGSYTFVDINAGTYEVQISTNTATIGQAPPAISLPGNWTNTGENVGAGSGDDGNPNGKLTVNVSSGSITDNANFGIKEVVAGACDVLGTNGGGFTTTITDVVQNCNSTYTITVRVEHNGCSGPSCKDLSHFSVEAAPGSYSNVSVNVISGNLNYNYVNGPNLGSDPFDGFKLDNTSGIGNGKAGVFEITYTLTSLQNQQFSAKAGNNGQITSFTVAQFQSVMNCNGTTCSTPTGSLNGTVFIDSDQLTDSQVDGVGVGAPDGTQLYANLINGSNQVVANTAVAANGTYSFSNVAAGSYSVVLSTTANTTSPSLPVNWINVGENASTAGIQNPADGRINSLTVAGGGTTANVDFGILKNVGTLSGTLYNDEDALTDSQVDGTPIQQPGGTQMYAILINGSNQVQASQAIAANGTYSFADVPAGSYSILISTTNNATSPSKPANWQYTGENASTNGVDGNADGRINNVTVTAGSNQTNYDFGIRHNVGSISGTLYNDEDALTDSQVDGTPIQQPGGTQMYAVLINGSNQVQASQAIAANGTYSFVDVPAGSYSILISTTNNATSPSKPANWQYTGENASTNGVDGNADGRINNVTVTAGSNQTNYDFGIRENLGGLAGNVYNDTDGDNDVDGTGIYQPAGSQLYATLLNSGNSVVASTTVGNDGSYSFTGLSAGNYSVVISTSQNANSATLPANWIHTGENVGVTGNDGNANGIVAATITAGSTTSNVNFGIRENLGGLAGNVYNDTDGDNDVDGTGIHQPAGSQLYATLLNSGNSVVASTAVGNDGSYSFTGLSAGNYSVVISTSQNANSATLPTNWIHTGENVGVTGNDGNANGIVAATVTGGSTTSNVNFGIRENLGGLAGNVYNDTDGDNDVDGTGIYQPAGSQLYATLLNSGNSVVASTAVGNDGSYSFTGLSAGNYSVVISTSQNANSATLPANWIHTGENVGTTGNDGNANGIVAATVSGGNVTSDVNFGIAALASISGNVYNDVNGLSDGTVNGSGIDDVNGNALYVNLVNASNQVVASMAVNPNGTYSFSGVQPGTYSVQLSSSLGTVGNAVPALNLPADWSTVGEHVGAGAGSDGNPDGILSNISATYGSDIQQVNFGLQQSATGLSGNVFNDLNGLTDNTVNGTGINAVSASSFLFVNVLDGSNQVLASQAVNPDGSYNFVGLAAGSYKVWLSSSLGTVGQAAPALNLPANWISTGENVGSGAGSDGTADGKLNNVAVVLGSITTEVNFGLVDNVTAISGNVFHDDDALTDGAVDGTGINSIGATNLYVNLVNASNKVVLSSLVNPDGTYSFSGIDAGTYTVTLSSTLGTAGQPVPALSLPGSWIISGENIGATPPGNDGTADGRIVATAVFGSSTTDVNFGLYEVPTGLSGNVFNDANGLTNNLVDGNGIQQASAEQLYINILNASNAVVGTSTVSADGSWSATGIVPGTYSAVVSTILGTVGQPAPAATLPAQWVNTGERIGLGNGHDGTVDGRLNTVAVVSGSITTEVNFGIQERPIANTDTEAPQGNPGGTNKVLVAPTLFTASDNDGSVTAIRLTTFPKNITTISINMVVYDAGTWPVNGVTIPTNANGNPTQAIEIDPIDGSISAIINFVAIDNAGFESLLPGSVTLPFTVTAGRITNNYPAVGYNSVSYEDLWPGTGDYDFNDLVVSYSFRVVSNASNSVDTLEATFILRAVGAAYKNGFGFQFGGDVVDPADIVSASGSQLTVGYVSVAANGLEAGQSKPTFILYENSFDLMPHPGGGGIGVNTDLQNPYVTPDTLVATFVFAPGKYTIFDLDLANFNPFLIVNGVRGREIHLPYYEPTDLADPSFFNTASDDSNPANGRYYVTPNNLPWAINISGYYEYPQEKVNILNTHLKFREWAESGGQLYADWFLDRPGYRAENNIYPEPNNDNGGVVNPGGIGKQEIKQLDKANIQMDGTVK